MNIFITKYYRYKEFYILKEENVAASI